MLEDFLMDVVVVMMRRILASFTMKVLLLAIYVSEVVMCVHRKVPVRLLVAEAFHLHSLYRVFISLIRRPNLNGLSASSCY